MHGGLISTVFDGTFGALCHYWGKQRFITTVSLSTTFLKPVLPGDTLVVDCAGGELTVSAVQVQ